jgi:hypothetical protein
MVCQSDWLPMMIATGFPAISPSSIGARRKEAGDYRGGSPGGKRRPPASIWMLGALIHIDVPRHPARLLAPGARAGSARPNNTKASAGSP